MLLGSPTSSTTHPREDPGSGLPPLRRVAGALQGHADSLRERQEAEAFHLREVAVRRIGRRPGATRGSAPSPPRASCCCCQSIASSVGRHANGFPRRSGCSPAACTSPLLPPTLFDERRDIRRPPP